jgi:hypothetical protein
MKQILHCKKLEALKRDVIVILIPQAREKNLWLLLSTLPI